MSRCSIGSFSPFRHDGLQPSCHPSYQPITDALPTVSYRLPVRIGPARKQRLTATCQRRTTSCRHRSFFSFLFFHSTLFAPFTFPFTFATVRCKGTRGLSRSTSSRLFRVESLDNNVMIMHGNVNGILWNMKSITCGTRVHVIKCV